MNTIELIDAVKRRIYGERYAGATGPVADWADMPEFLKSIIRECKRLEEDRTALRTFRELLLQSLRTSRGWSPELEAARGPAEDEMNALSERLKEAQGEWSALKVGGKESKRPKRSTVAGEGRLKLISALTKHHKYAGGGCLNQEPMGNNQLARAAGVARSTASTFFEKHFKGYIKYRAICRDAGRLADSLKALNGEFSPHHLYGRRPPNEDHREVDE